MNEQYKLDAKTEILNVIKYFKGMTNHIYPASRGYSSQNSPYDYRGQYGYNTGPSTSASATGLHQRLMTKTLNLKTFHHLQ